MAIEMTTDIHRMAAFRWEIHRRAGTVTVQGGEIGCEKNWRQVFEDAVEGRKFS